MNLLRLIATSQWMIHQPTAESFIPLIAQLSKGNSVDFNQNASAQSYVVHLGSENNDGSQSGNVAVMSFRDVIMKDDGWCTDGLESKRKQLQNYINDSNITAIVFDMDTPGGQASYLQTFAATIAKGVKRKPIVASYNNLCASAGYYLASTCTEMYAQEDNDIVGSIGTMITMVDNRGFFKKAGIKVEHLYATQSSNKNKLYQDAIDGKPSDLITRMLDPMAQSFIDHVKAHRSISEEEAFTGKTYLSAEAIEMGMIDGVMPFEDVLTHAISLAKAPKPQTENNTTNNSLTMNKNLMAVATLLGMTALESHDGAISFSVENVEKIGAEIIAAKAKDADNEAAAEEVEASNERMDAIEATATETNTKVDALQTSIDALTTKLESAIADPSAGPTEAKNVDDNPKNHLEFSDDLGPES